VIIGVHTPEFEFEKKPDNIEDAAKRFGILYPIAIDSEYKTWQNYNNRYWPAHYLIDQKGILRQFHFGEGGYVETENAIRSLLGLAPLEEKEKPAAQRLLTPETYLGFKRGDRYTSDNRIVPDATSYYAFKGKLKEDQMGLRGEWKVAGEKITSAGDSSFLDLNFIGTRVYLVMESDKTQLVTVYLDGKPLDPRYYTADMKGKGHIVVKEPRKYDVLNLHMQYGRHQLTLRVPRGVSLYAFTFGDEQ